MNDKIIESIKTQLKLLVFKRMDDAFALIDKDFDMFFKNIKATSVKNEEENSKGNSDEKNDSGVHKQEQDGQILSEG